MNPRLGTVNFSALRQLALYALYVVLGLMAAVWLLGLATNGTGSAVTGGAIDAENNAITFALRSEPPQLDYGRATDSTSITVLFHTMEGLLTYNDEMALIPGVAERWEIREDGATFWLREDARWSNGEPVTAHDFVFAWRRVQDPATASAYAFIMYPVKNAEAINRGDLPRETLGVRAVGDRILEVEFEQPTPYFDKLVAFVTFYPVNEAFFESADGRFGADADMLLYNGPYLMTEWVHSASMRWERNPDYWGEHKGFIDTINVGYITDDVNARLNLFKDGQIADTQLTPQMLGEAMERRWQIDRSMDGTVFFLQLNFREDRITANRNFRKALLLAQDPVEFVYKALKEPSYMPAVSLFPYWIRGAGDYFRQEHPPIPHEYNVARAREHLELARQELGLEEFPPIHLLADDSPLGAISSEYFQAVYARNLGLEMRIDKQIFKQRLAKMDAGDFDIVVSGWGPDYDDALTFGDLFSSWNLNNRGRYASPEMDALIRIAQSELDPVRRMEAFAEIQDLVHEDVVIVPMYERGWSFVVDPRLKGFKRRSVGPEVDYTYAWIDDQAAD
ncbi:MAG: peptide ABC transporter substrate-binding protein [Gammaproteobacteria bacterium]|nr:peptide ABC transporter substrate-binding protein [Gammaproteobacteria bacterium]